MNDKLTYYDMLQVNPGASPEVIKAAYRTLQKQMHPDMGGDTELAQAINEAGEVLTNPVERNRYDLRMHIDKAKTFSFQAQVVERVVERIVERTFVFCQACGARNRVEPDRMEHGRCGGCQTPFVRVPKGDRPPGRGDRPAEEAAHSSPPSRPSLRTILLIAAGPAIALSVLLASLLVAMVSSLSGR